MDHRSAAPRRSGLTIRSASLALALVGASLALAIAVRGTGEIGTDAAPVTPSASSPIMRPASWTSWATTSSTATPATPADAQSPPAARLAIQGVPPAEVNYGVPYSFAPTASGTSGEALTFSIQNKPSWAVFDNSSGALTGTPAAEDVGTDSGIVISVHDGASSTSLAPFSISVNEVANGAATLDWSGVTQTLADTALADLAGYIVYYGTSAGNLSYQVKLANPGLTSYMVTNLASATWYFGVAAYTRSGVVGEMSSLGQKTIP
jgi:Putative Ig domain